MEASDSFGGDDAATDEPASTPDEQTTAPAADAAPDLTEQEQALIAKIGGPIATAVAEQLRPAEQTGDTDPEVADLMSALYDDGFAETEPAEDGFAEQPQAQPEQQPQAPEQDQVFNHPAVQQLIQSHQQTVAYLQGREEREARQTLNNFAAENPDITKPDVFRDVKARVDAIAERAGDPSLRTDPEIVQTAYHATMALRAAAARGDGQPAPPQGAPIEQEAGASVGAGESSYKDRMWSEIKESGSSGF